jgi:hypothetical protein
MSSPYRKILELEARCVTGNLNKKLDHETKWNMCRISKIIINLSKIFGDYGGLEKRDDIYPYEYWIDNYNYYQYYYDCKEFEDILSDDEVKEYISENKLNGIENFEQLKNKINDDIKESIQKIKKENKITKEQIIKNPYKKEPIKEEDKFSCECGSNITKKSLKRHLKSMKHINFIDKLKK